MSKVNETGTFMTVAEIKRYLNISQAAAYELTRRPDFPVCRFGGTIRIPREAFLEWVRIRTHIPKDIASALSVA